MMNQTDDPFARIAAVLDDLDDTILCGWTHDDLPSNVEGQQIEATFHELSMHQLDLGNDRAWYIAGQIVSRYRRDVQA